MSANPEPDAATERTQTIVEMRGITKEYHGVLAVNDVTFDLREGEVHALLGENGAGKSTLTKMLSGVTNPTRGTIFLDGREVTIPSPAHARIRYSHGLPGDKPGALHERRPEPLSGGREDL